jgi:hypothetical protein
MNEARMGSEGKPNKSLLGIEDLDIPMPSGAKNPKTTVMLDAEMVGLRAAKDSRETCEKDVSWEDRDSLSLRNVEHQLSILLGTMFQFTDLTFPNKQQHQAARNFIYEKFNKVNSTLRGFAMPRDLHLIRGEEAYRIVAKFDT